MKKVFAPGDKKKYSFVVTKNDVAAFNNEVVHEVCSTFALAREIECSTRLFVLDMKDADEEGIGTRLEINHKGPAFVGETLEIEATVMSFEKNELLCTYKASVGGRLIAEGITGQKILKRERISQIFSTVQRK
ncbi:hypothetical protein C900_04100 [Fulvivirga imtechensis AK7]|uniref:Fluoroacetyl-CoA-specific thioesterase-like domain-containing protein n=1 Tax=Fulvivirga imtechensis AK7 TaxID=1237149 RepID=L8JPG4_9BACT|nr:hypothetical protein [Fulvivirga imtechensis]ELR70103.1 hypothetical protein C900_04100 [Fulvivirga imtechensis AK7]